MESSSISVNDEGEKESTDTASPSSTEPMAGDPNYKPKRPTSLPTRPEAQGTEDLYLYTLKAIRNYRKCTNSKINNPLLGKMV